MGSGGKWLRAPGTLEPLPLPTHHVALVWTDMPCFLH